MKISFVIPAYNEEKYIAGCIESILRTREGKGQETEILVINNASTDRTAEIATGFSDVRVVYEPRKGLTMARQRGLTEARGELVAYIDADSRVPSSWLDTALFEFSKHKNMVSLSGPFKYHDLPWFYKIFAEGLWYLFAPLAYLLVGYMILGANFIAKKEALIAMGGFDTSIDFYGEDTNIARRLHAFGKVVFKMNFFVYGSGRRLLDEGIFKTFFIYGLNFLWEVLFHKPCTRKSKDIR